MNVLSVRRENVNSVKDIVQNVELSTSLKTTNVPDLLARPRLYVLNSYARFSFKVIREFRVLTKMCSL